MAQSASAEAPTCSLAKVTSATQLHDLLSLRAVEVVRLASQPSGGTDDRLSTLVAPTAGFSMGAGDVILRLGAGIEGARALADTIHADTYRYLGWDYMDIPVDGCSSQKVSVEFVDSAKRTVARVEFTFDGGFLVKAAGWSDTFVSGRMAGENQP